MTGISERIPIEPRPAHPVSPHSPLVSTPLRSRDIPDHPSPPLWMRAPCFDLTSAAEIVRVHLNTSGQYPEWVPCPRPRPTHSQPGWQLISDTHKRAALPGGTPMNHSHAPPPTCSPHPQPDTRQLSLTTAFARVEPDAFIKLCFADPHGNPVEQAAVHAELQRF